MKRKYIGVGLMAALVFSAAPLSGTAGGTGLTDGTYTVKDPDVHLQQCVLVADGAKGSATLKAPKVDAQTLSFRSTDKVVVCVNVLANAKANAAVNLHLLSINEKEFPQGHPCHDDGLEGHGLEVVLKPSVKVDPNYSAKVSLDATAHAKTNVNGTDTNARTTQIHTGHVEHADSYDEDPAGFSAVVEKCKVVAATPHPEGY